MKYLFSKGRQATWRFRNNRQYIPCNMGLVSVLVHDGIPFDYTRFHEHSAHSGIGRRTCLFLIYEIVARRKPSDKFMERAQMVGMFRYSVC